MMMRDSRRAMLRRLGRSVCGCLACGMMAAMAAGCAGYRLGPTNGTEAGAKSVQISPFLNQTLEPRLSDDITLALRESLQKDGTYHLATHGGADIIVTGVITRYARGELSFVPQDVLTVEDFQEVVTAQVTAREAGTGKVLLSRPVTGSTLVRAGSDLASAERQARPLIAEDLARKITALLVDGSW